MTCSREFHGPNCALESHLVGSAVAPADWLWNATPPLHHPACLPRNRDKETRNVTALNVARYFLEIGTAALQALPILQAYGLIKRSHPLLQHPAINNDHYREYAAKQASYSIQLAEHFKLLETPVLGPVITQATPVGHLSSAVMTEDQRYNLVTGAVVTYAATSAAALTQAQGVDLSDKAIFMLVSPDERDHLLSRRVSHRGRTAARSGEEPADSSHEAAAAAEGRPAGNAEGGAGAGGVPPRDDAAAPGDAAHAGGSTTAAAQPDAPGSGAAGAAAQPGAAPAGMDLQVEGDSRAQLVSADEKHTQGCWVTYLCQTCALVMFRFAGCSPDWSLNTSYVWQCYTCVCTAQWVQCLRHCSMQVVIMVAYK